MKNVTQSGAKASPVAHCQSESTELPYKIIPGIFISPQSKQYTHDEFALLASSARVARQPEFNKLVELAKSAEIAFLAEQTNDFFLACLIQLADSTDPYILAKLSNIAGCSEINELADRSNNEALKSLIKCVAEYNESNKKNIRKIAIVRSVTDLNFVQSTDDSIGYIPADQYYCLPGRTHVDWTHLDKEKYTDKISLTEVVAFMREARSKGLPVLIQAERFNDEANTIVTAYLMAVEGYSKEQAVERIKERTGIKELVFTDEQNKALALFEKPQIAPTQKTAITLLSHTTSLHRQTIETNTVKNELPMESLHTLLKKVNRLYALMKARYAAVDDKDSQEVLDENYSIIDSALNSLKSLLSYQGTPNIQTILTAMQELPLAFNSIDTELKLNSADDYSLSNNVATIITAINQEIKRLEIHLNPKQVHASTQSSLINSSLFKPEAVANSKMQLGWNCFDVAVGLKDRQAFVDFALSHAKDVSYRKLLAPEIILAATLPAEDSTALPASMRTAELATIVTNYLNVHEAMRTAVANCNNLLNNVNGKRLSLEQLVTFFEDASNITKYPLAYTKFTEVCQSIYDPAVEAFHHYAERQDIYCQYIKDYYGLNSQSQGGWFVCHNAFAGEKPTSMIDIAAIYLKAKIKVHLVGGTADVKLHETAVQKGNREIEINWSGRNGQGHFVQRDRSPDKRPSFVRG